MTPVSRLCADFLINCIKIDFFVVYPYRVIPNLFLLLDWILTSLIHLGILHQQPDII